MEYPIPMVFVQVMATDDVRISINELEDSKMCTQSFNKIPSNFSGQVIESELGKPRTKNLEQDPNQLSEISVDENKWSIYKVPYPLREVNAKAYEPNVISIGPYHHGKKHLKTMEVIKRNCFSRMIKKCNAEPKKFVTVMKKLEKTVRKCYEEPLDRFDSDAFVEMMVLDGCFIVLLFQEKDYLLTSLGKLNKGILDEIYCDLLLIENQLPFFVLAKLYGVINMSNVEIDEFPKWDLSCLSAMIPGPDICLPKKFPRPKYIDHLLGLVHRIWISSASIPDEAVAEEETETEAVEEAENKRSWKFIRCATELEEAGISFKKKGTEEDKMRKGSWFRIDFNDGKLKIPTISVEANTGRILRNFVAYEQFLKSSEPTYVSDYVTLMDNLINSGKDVQLLCKGGIIDHWLSDDDAVAQMFNKLSDFTYLSNNFTYAEIFCKVDHHYNRPWNKSKAKLKKDYFNSPWSFISVLAAFVLLLLTLLQTIFSVAS